MLGAFLLGGFVAALFIFFFGFVGIYGSAVATLRPEWYASSQILGDSDVPNCFSTLLQG